jgi:P27 family predicted phage terminase small subunit
VTELAEKREEMLAGRPPALGDGMLEVTRKSWNAFWASKLAQRVVATTDLPALRRLFSLYDERERALRAYRRERLVVGSTGQPVINPMAKVMVALDTEIRALEDRFGLSPAARIRLGIALGEAKKTLEDMNRGLDEDGDEKPETEEDPRIIRVERKN